MRYCPIHLAVFAVGGTLVTTVMTYDLCMTKKYYVQEEWNVTKSGHQYHT